MGSIRGADLKITKKIAISFITMALLPIALTVVLIAMFGQIEVKIIESRYDIELSGYESLYNNVGLLDQITDNILEEIRNIKEEDADVFGNREFLNELNDKITSRCIFLAVKKGDVIIFNGSNGKGQETVSNIESIIEPFSNYSVNANKTLYMIGSKQYLVKQESFTFSGGKSGEIYVISRLNGSIPEIRNMNVIFLIIVVISMILIGTFLLMWIYKGVVKPVEELKDAANNISQGNLDFKIKQYKNNEFGELSEAFEEMRSHLMESIEENIKREEESKELISNISHDLKTPLTTIKGYVEGIMDGVADSPEKMDKYIKTIYNKANDMDRLIGELTIYSKIDTNKIPYNFVKLNIDDYFSDCIEEINTDLSARGIKLTFLNYVEKNVKVIADPEQIRRVINNIISNSVKYMDKKECFVAIRLSDAREDGFVEIEIEDNGKGMEANEIPHIFERFYRTDASRNLSQGGSGIGLAIVKKIIEAHGGSIWAISKKGIGTTMHFILRKVE